MKKKTIPAYLQSQVDQRPHRKILATGPLLDRTPFIGQKELGQTTVDIRKQSPLINRGLYTPRLPTNLNVYGVQSPTTSKTLL